MDKISRNNGGYFKIKIYLWLTAYNKDNESTRNYLNFMKN
jgi:hypothetical protein